MDTASRLLNPVGDTAQITIILNPVAGRGRGASRRQELEAVLAKPPRLPVPPDAIPAHWSIVETTGPGSATALASTAANAGVNVVAAAGGDGTCGAVVNGIVGTHARFGIVPLGTGNDLARCLGLYGLQPTDKNSKRTVSDLEFAVHQLFYGTPHSVDLGRTGNHWFINVAGCGFDAVVAERINRGFRFMYGTPAYIAAVLQSLATFRPAVVCLTLDGVRHEMRAMLCAVANAQSYGGGMRVAPNARMDDGLLDLCVIGDASPLEFLCAFPRVFKGTHSTHPKVQMFQARHVVIESDPALPVLVDGEICGTTPAEFTLVPGAIEVLGPHPPCQAIGPKV